MHDSRAITNGQGTIPSAMPTDPPVNSNTLSSPLDYLRQGEAYSQRGFQRMAIDVFNEGLSKLSSPSDPYYAQLERAKNDAEERDNKRVDFISMLPMDIVMHIAPRLIHEGCPLIDNRFTKHHSPLFVSKTWRQRFLEAGDVHVQVEDVDDWTPASLSNLIQLAPFINFIMLKLRGIPFEGLWSMGVAFPSLKKLSVTLFSNDMDNDSAPFEPDHIMEGLRKVGATLTHLKLHDHSPTTSAATISLQSVLDTCPHLTALDIMRVDPDLSAASTTYPRLTMLKLDMMEETPVSNEVVTQLLNKLPCLEGFWMNHCSDKMVLATFLDHCPSLRYVGFGVLSADDDESDDNNEDKNGWARFARRYGNISPGKMKLELENMMEDPFSAQELVTILKHYSPALEALTIEALIEDAPERADDSLRLDHLKQLVVTLPDPMDVDDDMGPILRLPGFILRHTPNVERVAIRQTQADASTMHIMTQLSHLKDVELVVDYVDEDIEAASIFTFLDHHKALGTESTLEKLDIHAMSTETTSAPLYGIERLSNLRELHIRADFPLTVSQISSKALKKAAETCPQLTTLLLHADEVISDKVMYALCQFKNLKELHVRVDTISAAGALSCLACRKLEVLEISCFNDIRVVFPVLKTGIPKVYSTLYD